MQDVPMPVVITVITALITSIIGPIIIEWVKSRFFHKVDAVGESIEKDEKIDLVLEQLMEELECDRICISQFHNGGNFYPTGKSIKKFSIFYERTNEATSVKQIFQNIPVSLFPKIFSILYKDNEIAIPDTKNNDIDCGLFQVKNKEYATKSYYSLAMRDLNNNFIGIMTISYYTKKYDFNLEEWILIRQKLGAMGSILTNYLKK